MLGKYQGYGILLIMTGLLLSLPLRAGATVPVSAGYEGPGGTVFVAMHYEDVSPVVPLQVKLEQDLIAIEEVFKTLQREESSTPIFQNWLSLPQNILSWKTGLRQPRPSVRSRAGASADRH